MANLNRRPLEFEAGDKVFLKISPMREVIRFGCRGKLNPRCIGPFEVLERLGKLEAVYIIFSEELNNLLPCNVREWQFFHSLSEIVYSHRQESDLKQCTGKRTCHIKPPLHEELGTLQSVDVCVGSN